MEISIFYKEISLSDVNKMKIFHIIISEEPNSLTSLEMRGESKSEIEDKNIKIYQ